MKWNGKCDETKRMTEMGKMTYNDPIRFGNAHEASTLHYTSFILSILNLALHVSPNRCPLKVLI